MEEIKRPIPTEELRIVTIFSLLLQTSVNIFGRHSIPTSLQPCKSTFPIRPFVVSPQILIATSIDPNPTSRFQPRRFWHPGTTQYVPFGNSKHPDRTNRTSSVPPPHRHTPRQARVRALDSYYTNSSTAPYQQDPANMCDWEEFLFTCGHSALRLKSYCHYARNSPGHQCRRVKFLRSSWPQGVPCDSCVAGPASSEVQNGSSGQVERK